MKLTRPSEVVALLERLEFQPTKTLGQNFLIDGNVLDRILDAAELQPGDTVLEVGPGLGVLSQGLLERGARVIGIERDDRLAEHLRDSLAGQPFELLHADALDVDLAAIDYDLFVSNLPYSVGSRILFDLFTETHQPGRIVVTVQREVGDRLVAGPGGKDYGLLGICAQAAYAVERVMAVKPTCFFPPPRVSSAVMRFRRLDTPRVPASPRFRQVLKRCFTNRRKTLGRIFREAGWTLPEGFDDRRRPETVTIEEWGGIVETSSGG